MIPPYAIPVPERATALFTLDIACVVERLDNGIAIRWKEPVLSKRPPLLVHELKLPPCFELVERCFALPDGTPERERKILDIINTAVAARGLFLKLESEGVYFHRDDVA